MMVCRRGQPHFPSFIPILKLDARHQVKQDNWASRVKVSDDLRPGP